MNVIAVFAIVTAVVAAFVAKSHGENWTWPATAALWAAVSFMQSITRE
jgi:hypothetical protein